MHALRDQPVEGAQWLAMWPLFLADGSWRRPGGLGQDAGCICAHQGYGDPRLGYPQAFFGDLGRYGGLERKKRVRRKKGFMNPCAILVGRGEMRGANRDDVGASK